MAKILSSKISMEEAIRRGMTSAVRDQLDHAWRISDYFPTSEQKFYTSGDEAYVPFELALDCKRWATALEIYEHRARFPHLLPAPEGEDDEDTPQHQRSAGPTRRDTLEKTALDLFLQELALQRDTLPLAKPLQEKLRGMIETVARQEGPDITFLRVLSRQPYWLDAVPWMLQAGASPNAYFIGHRGGTMNALTMAMIRGLLPATKSLLARGAAVDWRHHDGDYAVHRALDLTLGMDKVYDAADLEQVERRWQCVDLALAHDPSVKDQRGSFGRTVEGVRASGVTWLREQRGPNPKETDEAYRAAWWSRRMGLTLTLEHDAPRRPARRL